MNDYQQEQWDALTLAVEQIMKLSDNERRGLTAEIAPYLDFRSETDLFLRNHFGGHCTESCYTNQRSACCSKDGIITFWADVVINALCSNESALAQLQHTIETPLFDHKCIYLGQNGCSWQVRPLVCAMFLCDQVQQKVFPANAALEEEWGKLNRRAKAFRWPVKPVLFDRLELFFMSRGCRSPLMYINTSPGLLRIKRQGLKDGDPTR